MGFQALYHPATLNLKSRLLDGVIGQLCRVTVHAAGARGQTYYGRTAWAGRLDLDGTWVLDSPINNACAHELQMALFLAGPSLGASAHPTTIAAELYRGNLIQSFDTASLRMQLDVGVDLLVLMTHACEFFIDGVTVIEGECGRVYLVRDTIVIQTADGEDVVRCESDAREHMVRCFAQLVRDRDVAGGIATLESARAEVLTVNAAVQASPIYDIPDRAVRQVNTLMGQVRAVIGFESMLTLCASRRVMLNESKQFDWTKPAGRLDLHGYSRFSIGTGRTE